MRGIYTISEQEDIMAAKKSKNMFTFTAVMLLYKNVIFSD
jgi:hypothetical protein